MQKSKQTQANLTKHILIGAAFVFVGCTPAKFTAIDEVEKSKVLGQDRILEDENIPAGGQLPGGTTQPPGGGTTPKDPSAPSGGNTPSTGQPRPGTGGTLPADPISPPGSGYTPSPDQIPIKYICSTDESTQKGTNLVASQNPRIEVIQYELKDRHVLEIPTREQENEKSSSSGSVTYVYEEFMTSLDEIGNCVEDDPAVVAELKTGKNLRFDKCDPKGHLFLRYGNTYTVHASAETITHPDTQYFFTVRIIGSSGSNLITKRSGEEYGQLNVLFDVNGRNLVPGFPTNRTNQNLCDSFASPLFVDMRNEYEKTQKFSLSAPWDGVWFDILGQNAEPRAHAPYRISWFKSSSMAYIALPNKRGQVLGINELFGDNTMGPDGEFAANGYAALAKHDFNKDQLITAEDPVYAKLKIWRDRDLNGRASASELTSLADAKIEVIDLRYDAKFSEKDVYGNLIKYKSVAKMADGQYRLVFDIWFELNHYKAREHYYMMTGR